MPSRAALFWLLVGLMVNGCRRVEPPRGVVLLTVDTLRDMTAYKDIPKSLEYLADILGAPFQKFHMSQHSWRQANRLDEDGIALARKRCAVDVEVTEWVYRTMLERGLITKSPRIWRP